MKILEKTSKSVEDAIEEALQELGADRSMVRIEVLDEGSKGLLGFLGARTARVRVTYLQQPLEEGRAFLQKLLDAAGLKSEISATMQDENAVLEIFGDDVAALIGRRGQTLDSLQYLVNIVANRNAEEKQRLIVDVEGYRKRREESLRRLALRMADKVSKDKKKMILEPMTPQERRIIHTTLQNVSNVSTYSEGEDPYRRVIISPENRD
ncbi:MAG TPA: protein jag [Firmicutes bacterium]|jgi:spoIIIJ-associated protein|nr:protein jag [Bacillota bacterium]HAW71030.1 protein jag [Bacillota bacterium]HAZ21297.1 protein jag [Bacillota bacterium]HBE05270.1 protein jag [Bacillota bacterium]HBG43384.1 protein jag [Bacillota bacterium]